MVSCADVFFQQELIMLIRFFVSRGFGGIWGLRSSCLRRNPGLIRKLLGRLYHEYLFTYGSDIPLSTQFYGPACFPHGPMSIFISGSAKFGKDAVIFQQVTIGSNTLKDSARNGSPVLGDNVFIGAGAKIIGRVQIGNNVRVGAGAVVTQDVPDNATVVGVNKVTKHDYVPDTTYRTRHADDLVIFQDGGFVKVS